MGKKEKLLPPMLLTSHCEESAQHSVYNLLENRYRTTQIPVLRNKSVLGSAYGWLVLLDQTLGTDSEGECCLWNPTSMEIIQLQRLEDSAEYIKCVLSKSPTEPGCFIVFTQNFSLGQTIYKIGDNTCFKVNPEEEGYEVHAIVSFQGVVYGLVEHCVTFDCQFVTFHVVGDKLEARPLLIDGEFPWEISYPAEGDWPWISMHKHYFMESPCGSELLLVTRTVVDCYIDTGEHFRVFRVDVCGKEAEELENLDGRTVFIANQGNGFCRFSESFGSKIKSNCVYYTNSIGMVMYVYDLDDRSTITLQPYPDSADIDPLIDPLTSKNYWIDLTDFLKSSGCSASMITTYLPSTIALQPYPDTTDIDPLSPKNYWVDLPEILKSSGTVNWGELDGDLLNLILRNLFGKDRLSFSLVCKHWNAVASNSPYRYSPCLMYYHRRTHAWKFYQYNSLFNMSFPELENAEICCSKYGWLLMKSLNGTNFFFDPSNKQTIELPRKHYCVFTSLCFFNPPTALECVVIGIRTPIGKLDAEICIFKYGKGEWENMNGLPISSEENAFCVSIGAPVLQGGLIYYLSEVGDVAMLDIENQSLDVYYECLAGYDFYETVVKDQYLVKVNGEEDELFSVFVFWEERKVNVFRLSSEEMKWDSVESIGDKVFYISHTSSFGVKAQTKSMENTICFPEFRGDAAVFYSLSDAKYHSLDGGFSEGNAYGLKRFDTATWVMPMPAQEVIPTISSS